MIPLLNKIKNIKPSPSVRKTPVGTPTISSARDLLSTLPKSEGVIEPRYKLDKTVLEGGVKVISVDTPTPTRTLSLFLKAGSRYETRSTVNSTQFLKKLAFRGSNEKSAIRLVRDLEHIGSAFSAEASRDYLTYNIRGLRFSEENDDINLSIETETLRYILNPLLLEYEVEDVRKVLEQEVAIADNCNCIKAFESAHAEAFTDTGLGRPLHATSYGVSNITAQKIHSFVEKFFYPGDRILIVATGVKHTNLVNKLTPLFTNPKLTGKFHEIKKLPPLSEVPPTPQNSQFTGGASVRLPAGGDSHILISFPGVPVTHKDQVVLSVLAHILGKGNKELTGPGDAHRTSRLYSFVNSHPWLQSSEAFNLSYSDAGLFGVYSVADAGNASEHFKTLSNTIQSALSGITDSSVKSAKQILKMTFLRNITEDRFKLAEHIATIGSEPAQYLQSIDAVNLSDVQRVAKNLSSSQPIVTAVGDTVGIGNTKL
jgi:predicted Zn-dependent peptidase